jgi:hypothetical protein
MVDVHHPDTPRNRGDYDAPHMSPVSPADDMRTVMLNRVSVGAVLAGVVVALVVQLILDLLGIGVGAATLNPMAGAADNPSATGFSIGAGIWWTVSGILAALAGGYAAGRLAGRPKESTAGWHGVTAWALTTLIIFYLLTSTATSVVSTAYQGVANAAGNMASATGSTALAVGQTMGAQTADPFGAIERNIRQATGGNDPAALRDTAVAAMRAALTGDQAQAQQARDRAADALAKAQNIPIEQARTQVQQYEQQYRQAVDAAKQKAAQAADVTAKAVATGSLVSAIALILGGIAAWFGGRMGAVDPTITDRFARRFAGNGQR